MFQIERVSNKIGNKIAEELKLSNDDKEVIAYGAFALMQIILSIVLVAILGAFLDVMLESLLISFTISILRKYSGGVHADSSDSCMILGTLISVALALLIVFFSRWIYLDLTIFLGLIAFIWSYYIVYKLAPVDSLSKPIKKAEKRKRMKKGSILVLSAYFVIILLFIFLYYFNETDDLLIYSMCIYTGILWQIFTLTKTGHSVVGKMDTFISHIFYLKRSEV
jgi:accessory gene regulator B